MLYMQYYWKCPAAGHHNMTSFAYPVEQLLRFELLHSAEQAGDGNALSDCSL